MPIPKQCNKCKRILPRSEFYRRKDATDGLRSECKNCYLEWHRVYESAPHRRIRKRKYQQRYRKMNLYSIAQRMKEYVRRPERKKLNKTPSAQKQNRVHLMVNREKWRGRIIPQPCEKCGNEQTEAHHPDYDRPFHIIWLCRSCHQILHAEQRAKLKASI